jgi:hypothetical protein
LKLHHIGHITRSLKLSVPTYQAFGFQIESEVIVDTLLGVKLQFVSNGEVRLEFVEPLPGESSLANTLAKRSGAYHYAFELSGGNQVRVDWAKGNRMMQVIAEVPAIAFPGGMVSFYVARDGSLLELIRYPDSSPG